jgi:hypothetical protein
MMAIASVDLMSQKHRVSYMHNTASSAPLLRTGCTHVAYLQDSGAAVVGQYQDTITFNMPVIFDGNQVINLCDSPLVCLCFNDGYLLTQYSVLFLRGLCSSCRLHCVHHNLGLPGI